MAMKRTLLVLSFVILHLSFSAAQDASKDINKIKRDTRYIYAEATMKDLCEAFNCARAILEMKVGDWVRNQHLDEDIEVCIVKAKEHFAQLETRRGDFYRAFVYVRKNDIMPVADRSEVTIFEMAPVKQYNQPVAVAAPAIIIEEEVPAKVDKAHVLELTPEEKQMKQIRSFYDVEPYIKGLKSKGKLKEYGKYVTMPIDANCHLFVYDKQGKISALLRKSGTTQYNLNTLKEDNIKNYKNCGAIWFQLKD